MKAKREDETIVRLVLEMTPDEAEKVRCYLQRSVNGGNMRADEVEIVGEILDAIGRVF